MYDITILGNQVIIPIEQILELLEISLEKRQKTFNEDSSWNYGIIELEEQIIEIKSKV